MISFTREDNFSIFLNLIFSTLVIFFTSDVKANYDLKKVFDKASNDYENALSKYASVSRYKPNEIEESETSLVSQKAAFRRMSMDYVFQVSPSTGSALELHD